MTKVLRWIVLVWAVLAIPYGITEDFATTFFGLLFMGLIIGLMIHDIRKNK